MRCCRIIEFIKMKDITNSKIKVLLVAPYSTVRAGGIGTWTKSVLDYLPNDNECDVHFMNISYDIKGHLKGRFPKLRRIFFGSLDSIWHIINLTWNMIKYKPDVVHGTSSASKGLLRDSISVFIVEKLFKKHYVIHWHFGRIPEMAKAKTAEYEKLCDVHCHASASIVLDRFSEEAMLVDGYEHVYVVPNAITNAIVLCTIDLDVEKIQQQRHEGEVLFVGHVIKEKGVFELVKACCELPEVQSLIIVGAYSEEIRKELETIAQNRSDASWLKFTGGIQREEVFSYYKTASVFCLPSYTEGFPYVILESMAHATPIISTAVGAIPDILNEGRGVVVSPQNVTDLKDALKMVLIDKDFSAKMGKTAYKSVYENYTIETVYNQYKAVWKSVL